MEATQAEFREMRKCAYGMEDEYWKAPAIYGDDLTIKETKFGMLATAADFGNKWLDRLIWC